MKPCNLCPIADSAFSQCWESIRNASEGIKPAPVQSTKLSVNECECDWAMGGGRQKGAGARTEAEARTTLK